MKRAAIFAFSFLAFLTLVGLAQQPTVSGTAAKSKPMYYDTFKGPWIDASKWYLFGPGCSRWQVLECVREIQQGRLRLEVRNVGLTNSDQGSQFAASELSFPDPNSINSIKADVTLSRAIVVPCPTPLSDRTQVITKIQGNFFNTGSGDPADDVSDEVYWFVAPEEPSIMQVANSMGGSGLEGWTEIGRFPIGTPLTVSNSWDQTNHRFVSVVQVTGQPETSTTVFVDYSAFGVSDTRLPTYPIKTLLVFAFSPNCTTALTTAGIESFFDNVQVNVPLPVETK